MPQRKTIHSALLVLDLPPGAILDPEFWGPGPSPPLPTLPSLPSPPFLSPPLPLEVGPLNAARGSGGAL